MNIGEKIKLRRAELKLSQRDLSDKSDIPYRTIQQYEAGKFKPKAENMNKLLDALKLPYLSFSNLDELLENDDNSILSLAIGDRILAIRYCIGLSREELSEKAGITLQLLEEYESQKQSPSFEILYKISCILKVPAYWLTTFHSEDGEANCIQSDPENEHKEETKRQLLTDRIQALLIENKYSSDELHQIIEYMDFIHYKNRIKYENDIRSHRQPLFRIRDEYKKKESV